MPAILLSFTISFLIGLLIGIEREHSHEEGVQAIGVRTFILFALLGTLASILNQLPLTLIISMFVFSMIIFGYLRSSDKSRKKIDIGITTEISAAIVFCLGYMVPASRFVAIIVSALVLLVLIERQRLHALARKKFKPHEIETAIIFVIFALGILPILPNHTIDPWDLFNPYNFAILIVTIAAIQFTGYITIRLFGERFGMALTGFLGGLISSTAVFANLSQTLRIHPHFKFSVIASAMLATMAMLIEIMAIIFVASSTLFFFMFKPLIVMIVTAFILTALLLSCQKKNEKALINIKSPLNLSSILKTSIFIALTLVLVVIAKRYVGTEGIFIVSFLGGLLEIHGISLATALLYLDHHLTSTTAISALSTAILASFISKFVLLWSLTPARFALETSLCLLIILFSGCMTYWLVF